MTQTMFEIIVAGISLLSTTGFVCWKNWQINARFKQYEAKVSAISNSIATAEDVRVKTNRTLSEQIVDNRTSFNQHQYFINQRTAVLENRSDSTENRQRALEGRQSDIEGKHISLTTQHDRLQSAQDDLRFQHAGLRADFDIISKKITEKSQPVYIQNSNGSAICSKCAATVNRYFHDGPSVVCANCEPVEYAKLTK